MSTQATLPPETPAEAKSGGGVVLQRLVMRQFDGVTLYNADCRDVLPEIICDVILTDPPYGMAWPSDNQCFSGGKTRRGNGSKHPRIIGDSEPYDPAPVLEMKVPTVMWGVNHYWNKLPAGAALIWQKRNEHALGTFLSDAEIAYLSEGHGVYVCKKTFAGTSKSIEGGAGYNQPSLHPNQKPVMLMAWCLDKLKAAAGAIVCDPYMGSGTTAIACIRTGRNFVGIEKDVKHFETACERVANELAQGVLLPPNAEVSRSLPARNNAK